MLFILGIQSKKQKSLLVVAIDFGTTYSGYAYALGNEYKQDRNKIYTNLAWSSGDGQATYKTPTSILFRKKWNFSQFWIRRRAELCRIHGR